MARVRKGRSINGIVLVDKPQGVSSNHVVQKVKRLYFAKKAGHTGALDPLATGLLPVCLGEATKFSQFLLDADKTYTVTAKLGVRTDTSDADGQVVETNAVNVTEQDIKLALKTFIGQIEQVPSMFSALKHQGRPLYFYARQGITIERPARKINIYSIEWIDFQNNDLTLSVSCSKGTYIRTLIDDLGQVLNCGAHVTMLRRTELAQFRQQAMYTLSELEDKLIVSSSNETDYGILDSLLLPIDTPLGELSSVLLDDAQSSFFTQGRAINLSDCSAISDSVKVYHQDTKLFLGIGVIDDVQVCHPKRVVVN